MPSILLPNQNGNAQPVELTEEQKAQQVAQRVTQLAQQTYTNLLAAQKQGIQVFWNNPRGVSPQAIANALGTKAGKVFQLHGALTEAIVQIAAIDGVTPDISLPTNAFTINEDGTVTISDQPYVPQQ